VCPPVLIILSTRLALNGGERHPQQLDEAVTGCWLWHGRLDAGGYGLWQGMSAHRLAYRVFIGPLPARRHIDHLCPTRSCVNAPGGHFEAVTRLRTSAAR
jgi:hypothetical protein